MGRNIHISLKSNVMFMCQTKPNDTQTTKASKREHERNKKKKWFCCLPRCCRRRQSMTSRPNKQTFNLTIYMCNAICGCIEFAILSQSNVATEENWPVHWLPSLAMSLFINKFLCFAVAEAAAAVAVVRHGKILIECNLVIINCL